MAQITRDDIEGALRPIFVPEAPWTAIDRQQARHRFLLRALGSADISGLLQHRPARDLSSVEALQIKREPFGGWLEDRSTQYGADRDCPMLMCVRNESSGAWTKLFSIRPSLISRYHLQFQDAQPHPSRPESYFVPIYFQLQGSEEVLSAYVLCERPENGIEVQELLGSMPVPDLLKLATFPDLRRMSGDHETCDPEDLAVVGSEDMDGLLRHRPARDLYFVEPFLGSEGLFNECREDEKSRNVAGPDSPILLCVRDESLGAWINLFSVRPSEILRYSLQVDAAQPHPLCADLHFVPMNFQLKEGGRVWSAYVLCEKPKHYPFGRLYPEEDSRRPTGEMPMSLW